MKNYLLDDTDFVTSLSIDSLQSEYKKKKKELFNSIEQRYEKQKESLIAKKLEGIQLDKSHRRVLNACIFPFSQEGELTRLGYYFIRASPLAELGISNLDFLIFHPETPSIAIFGEAKAQVYDPAKVTEETKKRIRIVETKSSYVQEIYMKNLSPELEFVLGVSMSYSTEVVKTIQRKGGGLKVWGTGLNVNTEKPELSFKRPWVETNLDGRTMFHKDGSLTQKLSQIETSWEYKSIFPESHPFAKLSLLAWIRENECRKNRIY